MATLFVSLQTFKLLFSRKAIETVRCITARPKSTKAKHILEKNAQTSVRVNKREREKEREREGGGGGERVSE